MYSEQEVFSAFKTLFAPLIKEVVLTTLEEHQQAQQQPQVQDIQLTADEAANQLHTTKVSLWRWAKQGYLSPVKVGRKVFYWKSDIDKLLQRKEN